MNPHPTRWLITLLAWLLLPSTPTARASSLTNIVVQDDLIEATLQQAGLKLMATGRHVPMKTLAQQLHRKSCVLTLPTRPNPPPSSPTEMLGNCRRGVLVVGSLYQCGHCDKWHVQASAGFILTSNGAVATCYHVANQPTHGVLVVLTGDGRVCGVREVLAADEERDVAILQLDGAGFHPLPLTTHAPVGSHIYVWGHPENQYYTLTEGIVSRYFTGQKETGSAVMMNITADFGPGSSGCPVLNDHGEVVGMADNIVAVATSAGAKLIFKNARPAAAILSLIRPR